MKRRRSRSWWLPACLSGLVWCLTPTAAVAQNTLRGIVEDAQGNGLEGATIVLTELDQNLRIEFKSGKGGRFIRSGIPSGKYRVECELARYEYKPTVLPISGGAQGNLQIKMIRRQSPFYEAGFKAFSKGQYAEAVAAMEKVLAEEPNEARARFVLGASLLETGKADEALAQLEQVAASGTELAKSPTLLVTLGRAYLALGKNDKADESFRKAGDPAAVAGAFADLGTRAFNAGRLEEATRLFERAVERNPRDPDALYGLGLCLVKANEVQKAVQVFKTLIATVPDHQKAKLAADLLKTLEGKQPD